MKKHLFIFIILFSTFGINTKAFSQCDDSKSKEAAKKAAKIMLSYCSLTNYDMHISVTHCFVDYDYKQRALTAEITWTGGISDINYWLYIIVITDLDYCNAKIYEDGNSVGGALLCLDNMKKEYVTVKGQTDYDREHYYKFVDCLFD